MHKSVPSEVAASTDGWRNRKRAREDESGPRLSDSHEVPPASALDGDVDLCKVKQPYADLLVRGIKDCENRSWQLRGCRGRRATWMVVVASRSKPTSLAMKDADERLQAARLGDHTLDPHHIACNAGAEKGSSSPPHQYDRGCIVGMVRVVGCFKTDELPWPTVWHNPGDKAWMVDQAYRFDTPIPLSSDDRFQTRVSLTRRPQYRHAIERALGFSA